MLLEVNALTHPRSRRGNNSTVRAPPERCTMVNVPLFLVTNCFWRQERRLLTLRHKFPTTDDTLHHDVHQRQRLQQPQALSLHRCRSKRQPQSLGHRCQRQSSLWSRAIINLQRQCTLAASTTTTSSCSRANKLHSSKEQIILRPSQWTHETSSTSATGSSTPEQYTQFC